MPAPNWQIKNYSAAQAEIRDLAWKMLRLCRKAAPDLFEGAGPSCVQLGYCPENARQNAACRGRILTKEEALGILRQRERADGLADPAVFNGPRAEEG